MSKDRAPEVGDVWESAFAIYHIKTAGEDYCDCVIKNTFIRLKSLRSTYLIKNCKYLGKSKANINDLFKTENEE